MGLDFIREKAEVFTQKRDRSKQQELDIADLFSFGKSDELITFFRCQLTDDSVSIEVGLGLVARAFSEGDVRLMQRAKIIGYMLPEDAEQFTELMRKNYRLAGMLTVFITQEPAIDGVFLVRPKTSFKKR